MRQDRDPILAVRRTPRLAGWLSILSLLFAAHGGTFETTYRFRDPVDTPRLFATEERLQRTLAAMASDAVARAHFDRWLSEWNGRAATLLSNYQKDQWGFIERDRMIDLALGHALATRHRDRRGGPDAARMNEQVREVFNELLRVVDKRGVREARVHVAQGATMVSLAVAYDLLHPVLTEEERKRAARLLVAVALKPTLDGVLAPLDSPSHQYWAEGSFNWTTLLGGGAALSALALRAADVEGTFEAFDLEGKSVEKTIPAHAEDLLVYLNRQFVNPFKVILANNGGTEEGNGYHHDMLLPLMLTVESLQTATRNGAPALPSVTNLLAVARLGASSQIQAGIHMASSLSNADFDYGDGVWNLTTAPVMMLVADHARRAGNPQWRQAVWQSERRCGDKGATYLLFRSAFDFNRPVSTADGMAGFDPSTLPRRHTFFAEPLAGDLRTQGVSEWVVTWRSSHTDPFASALMFKGGDKHHDQHTHADVGHFIYENQGVRWTTRAGWPGSYELFWADGKVDWKIQPRPCTSFQKFAKRAESHNTLVVNPGRNDYLERILPAGYNWFWQFNPDQADGMDGMSRAWSPVEDFTTPEDGPWSATVKYAGAYERHGVTAEGTGRTFTFDPKTGALTVNDALTFSRDDNEVWWNFHTAARPVLVEATRVLLTLNRGETSVYLELRLGAVDGGNFPGFRAGLASTNLHGFQPPEKALWGYHSGKTHRERLMKVFLHGTGFGRQARFQVRLTPRLDLSGKGEKEVVEGLKALSSPPGLPKKPTP